MARRSSFSSRMAQYQREQERLRRASERDQLRAIRQAQQAERAHERSIAAEEKERKRLYLESRMAEVEEMNEDLDGAVVALEKLLAGTLAVDDYIDFDTLKQE